MDDGGSAPPFCTISVVTFANSEAIVEMSDLHYTTDLQVWHEGCFQCEENHEHQQGFKEVDWKHLDICSLTPSEDPAHTAHM